MTGFRVLLILGLVALCSGCKKPSAAAAAASPGPYVPTHAQAKLRTIKLWLGAEEMEAEMAITLEQQATGMMFRTNRLGEHEGMIFPMASTQRVGFWMDNCPVPLAAAYIDPDGIIQEIHAFHANDTNTVWAGSDNIRFVLETSEGWFARHHIGTGTVVRTESGSLMGTFFPKSQAGTP